MMKKMILKTVISFLIYKYNYINIIYNYIKVVSLRGRLNKFNVKITNLLVSVTLRLLSFSVM